VTSYTETSYTVTYCTFCGRWCFVRCRIPARSRWRPGQGVWLATCPEGAAWDRQTIGADYMTMTAPPSAGRTR
jgi:hypothetical protein